VVFDPFAGTGTTLVVAEQLGRKSIGVEIDPANVKCIDKRLKSIREADSIAKYYKEYINTDNLKEIWGSQTFVVTSKNDTATLSLFTL